MGQQSSPRNAPRTSSAIPLCVNKMKAQIRPVFVILNVLIASLAILGMVMFTIGLVKFDNFAPVFISILVYTLTLFCFFYPLLILKKRINRILITDNCVEIRNLFTGKLKYKIDLKSEVEIMSSHVTRAFYPNVILIFNNKTQVLMIDEINYSNYETIKETLSKYGKIKFTEYSTWDQLINLIKYA